MHFSLGAALRIDSKVTFRVVVIIHALSNWSWQCTLRERVTKGITGVTWVASSTCYALIILSALMCLAVPECFVHACSPLCLL
jgi:hypothetical protein